MEGRFGHELAEAQGIGGFRKRSQVVHDLDPAGKVFVPQVLLQPSLLRVGTRRQEHSSRSTEALSQFQVLIVA